MNNVVLPQVDMLAHRLDDTAPARHQPVASIGRAPALGDVREVERHHMYAAVAQAARELDHERMALAGACAVSEDQRPVGPRLVVGEVHQPAHALGGRRGQL